MKLLLALVSVLVLAMPLGASGANKPRSSWTQIAGIKLLSTRTTVERRTGAGRIVWSPHHPKRHQRTTWNCKFTQYNGYDSKITDYSVRYEVPGGQVVVTYSYYTVLKGKRVPSPRGCNGGFVRDVSTASPVVLLPDGNKIGRRIPYIPQGSGLTWGKYNIQGDGFYLRKIYFRDGDYDIDVRVDYDDVYHGGCTIVRISLRYFKYGIDGTG